MSNRVLGVLPIWVRLGAAACPRQAMPECSCALPAHMALSQEAAGESQPLSLRQSNGTLRPQGIRASAILGGRGGRDAAMAHGGAERMVPDGGRPASSPGV